MANSIIITGTRTAEEVIRVYLAREQERRSSGAGSNPPPRSAASTTIDHILLRDIRCIDADGTVFEQYPELRVACDIVRTGTGHRSFTPYLAISYFEQQQPAGLFLPSVALSCNIVAALFTLAVEKQVDGSYKTKDPIAKALLDHYNNHGAGHGWHAENSVIDYQNERIIHYPTAEDFPAHGGTQDINQSQTRKALAFTKVKRGTLGFGGEKLENVTLDAGLKRPL